MPHRTTLHKHKPRSLHHQVAQRVVIAHARSSTFHLANLIKFFKIMLEIRNRDRDWPQVNSSDYSSLCSTTSFLYARGYVKKCIKFSQCFLLLCRSLKKPVRELVGLRGKTRNLSKADSQKPLLLTTLQVLSTELLLGVDRATMNTNTKRLDSRLVFFCIDCSSA